MDEVEISQEINENMAVIGGELQMNLTEIIHQIKDNFNNSSSIITELWERAFRLMNRLESLTNQNYTLFVHICDRNELNDIADVNEQSIQSIRIEMIPNKQLHLREKEQELQDDFDLLLHKQNLEHEFQKHCHIIITLMNLLQINHKRHFAMKCITQHIVQCFSIIHSVWVENDEITIFMTQSLCNEITKLLEYEKK